MKQPKLQNTPIKETIFSISYNEIIDETCFDKFVKSDIIKNNFKTIIPITGRSIKIDNEGVSQSISKVNNGYQLRNNKEVIQLRKGSFSYHYLHDYQDFNIILVSLIKFWDNFNSVTIDKLTVTNISVRYINLIENESNFDISHFVQLYPKRSNDRDVLNFQNSVTFKYKDKPEFFITTVSTQPKENIALLDVSVLRNVLKNSRGEKLKTLFEPMREIKNRAFFDSITAKALIKYIG